MATMRRTDYHSEFCSFGDFSAGSATFIYIYIYIYKSKKMENNSGTGKSLV
jgi:hypothetical protein